MPATTTSDVQHGPPKDEAALPPDDDAPCHQDSLSQIRERLLIACARNGDRAAFSALVDAYDRRLLYFIRRILGETGDALDVLQTVWLQVHRGLTKLRAADAFRVWLYRIAHDLAISELRRSARWPLAMDSQESAPAVDDSGPDAFENAELVHMALTHLSIDHRRVLSLRFLEDMPIAEIAQVLGENEGTIKSRLHYAKRALRMRIEELKHE